MNMNTKIDWNALTETLKTEVQRISVELKKFDYQKVLSPAAQQKVKAFEKRYSEVVKQLHKVQRQADREFNRLLRQVKDQRVNVLHIVTQQRSRFEKASKDLRDRFKKQAGAATSKKKTAPRKKAVRSKKKA
jgi:hypothetical protein